MPGEAALARARALLGVPFRLHGRSLESGLDCVGVIAVAHDLLGDAPTGYSLRTTQYERWITLLDTLAERIAAPEIGAVMLLQPGAAQLHLGLWTGTSLIHADAGLRRVVETPGVPRWPVMGLWRPHTKD
jgi:hypothetical protein